MAGNLVEILIVGKNMSKEAFREVRADGLTMGNVLKGAGVVGAEALVAVGVESVKMASEYQLATTRLVTSAGEQRKNLKLVQDGMLTMAGQVGISAQKLAEGMYYVEAAGYRAGDGLTVLRAAAQGAVTENADLTDVSKALTDVLVDYHLKASAAATVTSQMIMGVAHGKVNLEDYAKAFANIVPAASAAGISFADVSGVLSEMTNHGFTAQRAAQNMAQALRSMEKPTGPMIKEYKALGGSVDVLAQKLSGPNGLSDGMLYASQIAERAGKIGTPQYAAALRLLMGTAAGTNVALSITGENAKATSDTITAVAGATADASGKVSGFALVQKTFGQQMRQLDAGFQSLLIRIGDKLMPVLSKFIGYVMSDGTPIMKQLGDVAQQYVVPVLNQLWQVIQNLYPVAVEVFKVLGVVGYGALVAVSDVLKSTLLPMLISFTSWLGKNKDLVDGVVIGYLAYKGAMLGMEAATWLVESATKAWTAAQWLLNFALDANPIGLVAALVVGLAGGFYLLYNRSLLVRQVVATTFTNMGAAAGLAARSVLVAFKFIQDAILNLIGFNLDMGAKLFGWLPGIGPKLKQADQAFNQFQKNTDANFDSLIAKVDDFQTAQENATKIKVLQMDIGAYTQNIDAAKAKLASLPPSKRVAVYANIADLVAKRDAAQSAIDKLQGKTVNVYFNGINEGSLAGSNYTSTTGFTYAAGGVVSTAAVGGARGGRVLVGEHGPELVKLPSGSSVMPAGQTRQMLADGGRGVGRIQVEWVGGNAGDDFMRWLRNNIRFSFGGDVQRALGQGY